MDSSKYWKYDIEDGVRGIKVGIKNLINYLKDSPEDTKVLLSDIHINLVIDCIKEQQIRYRSYTGDSSIEIELIDLGISIDCIYNINEIEFMKYNPELEIDF